MEPAPRFRQTRRTHRASTLVIAVACAAFLPIPAPAANITTTFTATSGDWQDPANWSDGIPLNDLSNLYLPLINPGTVTLNANLTTSGLFLAQNSLLTLSSNYTYSVLPCDFGTTAINNSQIALQSGAALNVSANMALSNATISGNGTYSQLSNTLSIDRDSSISNLVIDNATLSATSLLTITNTLTLLDNTLLTASDTGNILAQTSLTVSGNATADHLTFKKLLGAGTLTFTGTANTCLTSATINGPTLIIAPSALFSPAGRLSITAGSILNYGTLVVNGSLSGSGTFTNSGLLNFGTSNSNQTISIPIVNSGTILSNATTFRMILSGLLANSGTVAGAVAINGSGSSSGLFSGDTPAGPRTLTLAGFFTLNNGARISSPNGGLVSATGNFPWVPGTITINGLASADHFAFSDLKFNSGTLELSGPNTWSTGNASGGLLSGSSLLHILPDGTLTLSNSGFGCNLHLTNLRLFNEGVLDDTPPATYFGLFNSVIDNAGTLTIPAVNVANVVNTSAFYNSGLLIAPSNATISTYFYNSGTVTLNSKLSH